MTRSLSDYFVYPGCILRQLQEPDILETVSLLNTAFKYQEQATGHQRTNPDHLRQYMKKLNCFVIVRDHEIIGTVAFEENGEILHFGLVSVAKQCRGTGLANAIMRAIEDYAVHRNFKILELDFMSIAPWLEKYYKKYGFKKTGHTERWKDTDLIQMHKKVTKN